MNQPRIESEPLHRRRPRKGDRRVFLFTLATCSFFAACFLVWVYAPAIIAYRNYTPQAGDIIFQSLPHSRLVNAIEGATGSPYSHCGIVAKEDGNWVVYEAYRNVEVTNLREFIFRGRKQGFAVYRLKDQHQHLVTPTLEKVSSFVGRPYDVRYRMDDEAIYCSELIYKAFELSSGQKLGKLQRFGDMNWQPYKATVLHYERGPVPVDRQMITPKGMSQAHQLERIYSYAIRS